MMDFIKTHEIAGLLLILQVLIVWLWIWVKAWKEISGAAIRRITGCTAEGLVRNAANDIIDSYNLQPGQKLTLVCDNGFELTITRARG